jgi:ribosomal protein L14
MLGERLVNDETLRTFLTEVEKIMNDRPITSVSSDPRDLEALTPNHVLLLRQNTSLPPNEIEDADKYRARWKHAHLLANEFWQRWTKEYLPTLQERQKWLHEKPNFKIGDLVLVADKNTARGQWPKALIEQTMPDKDGVVRQVIVRTAEGTYRRDVRKLCILEENLLERIQDQGIPSKKQLEGEAGAIHREAADASDEVLSQPKRRKKGIRTPK